MSYSGSQQQFGLSDLQLLQQHVMLARMQELQKQQQLGQFGEVQPQSSYNHLSRFGKQFSVGQIPNLSGRMSAEASEMFSATNMNSMHRNISLPMQGISSGSSYLHAEGLMMNPSLQKADVSLHGTLVTSGRGSLGHYSPLQGVSQSPINVPSVNSFFGDKHSVPPAHVHSLDGTLMLKQGLQGNGSLVQGSVEMLSSAISSRNSPQVNSLQKNMSLLGYRGTHEQPGRTDFLREQIKHSSDAQETAKLDPLEEKILFDTEESGWDGSFCKLATIDSEEFVSTSGVTEITYPLPSVHSGSWSALMQSAVAEASSSDTGVQEEVSGLSFQNPELSTDNQPSNFVTSEKQHVKSTDGKPQSSSYNLKAPPSCDSIMSSVFHTFHQTGLHLTSEKGVNTITSDTTIEQQPLLSQSSKGQQQVKQYVSVGHLGNYWVGQKKQNLRSNAQNSDLHEICSNADGFQWSRSPLLGSGMTKNNHQPIQQQMGGHGCMPVADGTLDQKEKRYNSRQLSYSPMDDASNKKAAQTYESQSCYRGENSSDSYNSKVSQTYAVRPDYAEDSESSVRSSQKSPNQALSISSPGAVSQHDCFGSLNSSNVFHTYSNSMIKGKPIPSTDLILKGSSASHIRASLNSQHTSESNKAKLPRDHESTTQFDSAVNQTQFLESDVPKTSASEGKSIQDIFSFQSSVPGDLSHVRLGTGQKGQTWWTPSSFGYPVPPLQEASLEHNWSGKSSILGSSGFGTSNLNSERISHEAVFLGPFYVENQLKGKRSSNVSAASELCPETDQRMSLSGSSQGNVSTSGFQYSTSGTATTTQSFISEANQLGVKPQNVWMSMSSRGDAMAVSCKVSSSSPSYLHGKDPPSLARPSSEDSQFSIGEKGLVNNKRSHEQESPVIQGDEIHESVGKYLMVSGEAFMHLAGSTNQQESIKCEQNNTSSTGASSKVLQPSGQPQHYIYTENVKQELDSSISINIAEADMNMVDFNSSLSISNPNVHQIPNVPRHQRLHEVHMLSGMPVDGQLNAASFLGSCLSSGAKPPMEITSSLSDFQHIDSLKMSVFGQNNIKGHSYVSSIGYDRTRNLNITAPFPPSSRKQYEDVNNGQILSLSDASVVTSAMLSETFQLSGTHNGVDGSKDFHILPSLDNQIVNDEQVLLSSALPADASNMNQALSNPKKRKFAIYECLPWHDEVMQTCQDLPGISIAEREWAKATNRLIEKRVDEGNRLEEMRPAGHAKRRLILTTQLMQQVFRSPGPAILSVHAASEYEIMAYFVAKSALADACSLMNKKRTDCHNPIDNGGVGATSPRNVLSSSDLSLVKAAEELFGRVKKLESHLDGLNKSLSIVDVRLGCQELEKFYVMNHFAKYHSRVIQSTAVDSASSSAPVASVRPFLQRYVTAIPLPHKLPEGVHCLSL